MKMRKLLNKRQVAQLIGVAPRTINELVHRGDFPQPLRIGRIVRWTEQQVVNWIDENLPAERTK